MNRDELDYAILKFVDRLSSQGDVFGTSLFEELKTAFPSLQESDGEYLSNRCLVLEERRQVALGGHADRRRLEGAMPQGIFTIRLTATGEDALLAGQSKFKEVGLPVIKNTHFNAPVHAVQLATGDNSNQQISLNLGELLKLIEQGIEDAPNTTAEQKEEAKSALQKLKSAIPTTAQMCTIVNFLARFA